jgi:hypothetical protein
LSNGGEDAFEILSLKGTRKILKALAGAHEMKYKELVAASGFIATTMTRALKGRHA